VLLQTKRVLGAGVSPVELRALILAEREAVPFLFLRDQAGELRVVALSDERLVVGRAPRSDLELFWDPRVSAAHAYLERRGARWVIEDDGLSRNGTLVGDERLRGQRALRDGDIVQVGNTLIGFRDPGAQRLPRTLTMATAAPPEVSRAQRRILIALCRPLAEPGRATPATNEEIAGELVLTVAAVKSHLRALFERFGLEHLPQNQKRACLAEHALTSGAVRLNELPERSAPGNSMPAPS
jgi:hypothetical protein